MSGPILLLGKGYTGFFLHRHLLALGRPVRIATRHPATADEIRFNLDDESSWKDLPESAAAVWLFPATPLEQVKKISERLFTITGRLIVIGTTSSYLSAKADATVDESSPLNPLASRVLGEEFLRSRGAIVLRSAGIYGPAADTGNARDPLEWLRGGLIAEGRKFLNVIQVEDLARTIIAAIDRGRNGEQYIVSDGLPMRWEEIASLARDLLLIENARFSGSGNRDSKQLSNRKMRDDLGVTISVTLKESLSLRAQQSPRHP